MPVDVKQEEKRRKLERKKDDGDLRDEEKEAAFLKKAAVYAQMFDVPSEDAKFILEKEDTAGNMSLLGLFNKLKDSIWPRYYKPKGYDIISKSIIRLMSQKAFNNSAAKKKVGLPVIFHTTNF